MLAFLLCLGVYLVGGFGLGIFAVRTYAKSGSISRDSASSIIFALTFTWPLVLVILGWDRMINTLISTDKNK